MSAHDWNHVVSTLGWTLIHFLWQGLAVALALESWLCFARKHSAQMRYVVRCCAFFTMTLAPALTFAVLWERVGARALEQSVVFGGGVVGSAESATTSYAPWLPWLVALWAVGAALFAVRLGGGMWQVLRMRRQHVGVELPVRWRVRFDQMASEFGVRARARIVDSAAVAVPTVIGWIKPVVLLPARIFSGLSDEQIEALVAHELAHIARYDYLVNIAQSIAEALLFYHPAVWWMSRGIRVEREYCCDDRAVATAKDGLSYARALTALESWRGGELKLGVSTLGGSFMQRIQRLVGKDAGTHARVRPFHGIGALFVLASMGASAFGFSRIAEPVAVHDCGCCCHQRATAQTRYLVVERTKSSEIRAEDEVMIRTKSSPEPETFLVANGSELFTVESTPSRGWILVTEAAPREVSEEGTHYEIREVGEAQGVRKDVTRQRLLLDRILDGPKRKRELELSKLRPKPREIPLIIHAISPELELTTERCRVQFDSDSKAPNVKLDGGEYWLNLETHLNDETGDLEIRPVLLRVRPETQAPNVEPELNSSAAVDSNAPTPLMTKPLRLRTLR